MVAIAAIPLGRKLYVLPPPSTPVAKPVVAASSHVATVPQPLKENPLLARLREQAEAANAVAEEKRDVAWNELVNSFSPAEIPEALRTLSRADDEASVQLRQLLVRRWATSEPSVAADWAVRFADAKIQKESLQQVAAVWSQTSLPKAIEWAQNLPDDLRPDVCLTLAYEAARTDPKTALTLAADLPANQAGTDLILHSAAQWAVGEPAAAAEWAKQISDETLRDEILSAIATEWGTSDPVAAANLAVKFIREPKPRDDAVIGIVQRWAQTDPQAAADWVKTFPVGNLQQTALNNLVSLGAAPESPAANEPR
jgi:hypothetical protein